MEDDSGSADGDNLLEDTSDRECNNRGSLQQSKLGSCHTECKATGEKEKQRCENGTVLIPEYLDTRNEVADAFDGDGDNGKDSKHYWRKKEDTREGIGCGRVA